MNDETWGPEPCPHKRLLLIAEDTYECADCGKSNREMYEEWERAKEEWERAKEER